MGMDKNQVLFSPWITKGCLIPESVDNGHPLTSMKHSFGTTGRCFGPYQVVRSGDMPLGRASFGEREEACDRSTGEILSERLNPMDGKNDPFWTGVIGQFWIVMGFDFS